MHDLTRREVIQARACEYLFLDMPEESRESLMREAVSVLESRGIEPSSFFYKLALTNARNGLLRKYCHDELLAAVEYVESQAREGADNRPPIEKLAHDDPRALEEHRRRLAEHAASLGPPVEGSAFAPSRTARRVDRERHEPVRAFEEEAV